MYVVKTFTEKTNGKPYRVLFKRWKYQEKWNEVKITSDENVIYAFLLFAKDCKTLKVYEFDNTKEN